MAKIQYDDSWAKKIFDMYQTEDIIKTRLAVIDELQLTESSKYLDVGCGPGFLVQDALEKWGIMGKPLVLTLAQQ